MRGNAAVAATGFSEAKNAVLDGAKPCRKPNAATPLMPRGKCGNPWEEVSPHAL